MMLIGGIIITYVICMLLGGSLGYYIACRQIVRDLKNIVDKPKDLYYGENNGK